MLGKCTTSSKSIGTIRLDAKRETEENITIMKTFNPGSFIAKLGIFLALTSSISAGTITITSGPTYVPATAVSNNTFMVTVLHNPPGVTGDTLQATGGATVTQPASNTFTVSIEGSFTANAGDRPSVAYSVTMDANAAQPIAYSTSATVTFLGIPQTFTGMGTIMPGLHLYNSTWQSPQAFPIAGSGTWSAMLTLNFAAASNPEGATPSSIGVTLDQMNIQLANTAATVPPESQPVNVSTRLQVLTEDNVLIGGFIIAGPDPKQVLLRGIGPSLSGTGVNALPDPVMELHGPAGFTTITNDDWRDTQGAAIKATGIPPTNDLESATLATLDPGAYTAIVRGNNNTTGVGLVEAYDLSDFSQTVNSQLANISTRGLVGTANDVMIGGFILGPNGNSSSAVAVRGIGPSLAGSGVPNALQDPILELHGSNGELISSNDNWMDNPNKQTFIDNGLAPTNDNESAILAIPGPGSYTAILEGANNGTGVGLVEVYHL